MALKGAREPVAGVKGAKGPTRLREPKVPRQPETQTSVKLGEEYLRRRNRILAIKEKREAIELACVRDELIEKPLAIRQLTYVVIAARQRLLAIPSKCGNHFGDREVAVREVVDYLRGEVNAALSELARLPEAVEANWQERLEED
jgi:hypothetical protein